jgi:4'-phosphopantetheinyl transferase
MPVASGLRREAPDVQPLPPPLVRVVPLDIGVRALAAERRLLTPAELAHAGRGIAPVARRRIALRAALRRLAGELLDLPPAAVPLRVTQHGRPELDVPDVDVSCSRAGEVGLVVVAVGRRTGVDVEPVPPWRDDVLGDGWLSPAERSALRTLDPTARATAVTRCWTRKEAVLKGLGTGLIDDLPQLDAGVMPGEVIVDGWLVRPVAVPAGYVASVATVPPDFPEEPVHGCRIA